MSGFKTPSFWYREPGSATGLTEYALFPFSILYGAGQKMRRQLSISERVSCPVVCVGNIVAGGSGKTPSVAALWTLILESGIAETPWILTRGYGGTLSGPVLVDPTKHRADQVGDEPLMLAARGMRVVVCTDRVEGAWFAIKSGADLILMDDGFQNPALAKDLSIIVADAGKGFGNGLCLPAGPLREPVATGLARADFCLTIGDAAAQERFGEVWGASVTVPRLTGALAPLATGMDWQGLRVLAFAGIGHPEKFFRTLRDLGAEVLRSVPLDDHQPLTTALLHRIESEAAALGAQLVTTEKDAVRLPDAMRANVLTVPVRLELDDWAPVDGRLAALGL